MSDFVCILYYTYQPLSDSKTMIFFTFLNDWQPHYGLCLQRGDVTLEVGHLKKKTAPEAAHGISHKRLNGPGVISNMAVGKYRFLLPAPSESI